GKELGHLTGNRNRILVAATDVSGAMQHAVIAIEDQRFNEHNGIDARGIARALFADLTRRKAVQGASTIPQQFVKNALATQRKRTIFEKLREAALAYHLTRKWSKDKILTEYLNSIYFGNGAYGVESAARVYFGDKLGFDRRALPGQGIGCGDSTPGHVVPECVSVLAPYQSALRAGMVASPSLYGAIGHAVAAKRRRDLVLLGMYTQHYITREQYDQDIAQPLASAADLQQPQETTAARYFPAGLTPQSVAAVGRN